MRQVDTPAVFETVGVFVGLGAIGVGLGVGLFVGLLVVGRFVGLLVGLFVAVLRLQSATLLRYVAAGVEVVVLPACEDRFGGFSRPHSSCRGHWAAL